MDFTLKTVDFVLIYIYRSRTASAHRCDYNRRILIYC